MPYEYLYLDSKHSRLEEKTSKLSIQLTHPIHHAKTVSLASFSTANEIYNIREPFNNITVGVVSDNGSKPEHQTYIITKRLYDIESLVVTNNLINPRKCIVYGLR